MQLRAGIALGTAGANGRSSCPGQAAQECTPFVDPDWDRRWT